MTRAFVVLFAAFAVGCGSGDDGLSASEQQAVEVFVSNVADQVTLAIGLGSGSTPSEGFSGFLQACPLGGSISVSCRNEAGAGTYAFVFDDCTRDVGQFPMPGDHQVWSMGQLDLATPGQLCSFPYPGRGLDRELRYEIDSEFRDAAGKPVWSISMLLESHYDYDDSGAVFSAIDADVQPSCSEPMTVRLLDELRVLPARCRTVIEVVDGSIVVTEVCDGPRECVYVGSFEVEVSGGVHIVHYSADDITIDFGADGSIDRVLDDCLSDELATCDQRESTAEEE